MNLASFDVIGEAGDEEGVDAVAAVVRLVEEVGVERLLVSHRQRRLWRSAACQSPSTKRQEILVGICQCQDIIFHQHKITPILIFVTVFQ